MAMSTVLHLAQRAELSIAKLNTRVRYELMAVKPVKSSHTSSDR